MSNKNLIVHAIACRSVKEVSSREPIPTTHPNSEVTVHAHLPRIAGSTAFLKRRYLLQTQRRRDEENGARLIRFFLEIIEENLNQQEVLFVPTIVKRIPLYLNHTEPP